MINKKEWFIDWFNSPFYSYVYNHRDENESFQFVNYLESCKILRKDFYILDFCCGNGRLSIELAKRNYKIKGVDISENLLNQAKLKMKENALDIDFELCDIRNLNSDMQFDLLINFFTSFGYFTDSENKRIFNLMSNLVKNDGYLILDFFNINYLKKNLVKQDVKSIDGITIFQERTIDNDRITKNIRITQNNNHFDFFESIQIYSFEDLIKLFEDNSLKIVDTIGNYDGSKFNDNSPRLILVGQKN